MCSWYNHFMSHKLDQLVPTVIESAFEVCPLSAEHEEFSSFALRVEYRGRGGYAVSHFRRELSADGTWDYPTPERTSDYLRSHRFSQEEAIQLAKKHCHDIIINGLKPRDVLALDKLDGEEWRKYRLEAISRNRQWAISRAEPAEPTAGA